MSKFTAGRFEISCADSHGLQWTLQFRHNGSVTSEIRIINGDELLDLQYVVARALKTQAPASRGEAQNPRVNP